MDRLVVRRGILFVLIGPSGSGKSTFCARLIQEFPDVLRYSTSATSRPPRPKEVNGKSYHFMTREEFLERRERGEFFEWEENHGNLYGTLSATITDGISAGRDLLFQIDIRGALNFKQHFPENTVTVFIVPPSFEVLTSRLHGRGTVDSEELRRRFNTARDEYAALMALQSDPGKIDYLVVNDDLDRTYDRIRSIVLAEQARYHRMDPASVAGLCSVGEGKV